MPPPHTSPRTALHPPRDTWEKDKERAKCVEKNARGVKSVLTLTWLLHSLKRGPVITRHDCSTVTNFTMLSLQGAGICTDKDTHKFSVVLFGEYCTVKY